MDPDAAVLTSPWCLYGIWLCLNARRSISAPPGPAGGPTAASFRAAPIVPLCTAGVDALLVQLAWENLSLLQSCPHTSDTLHALILEEVAAEPPLPGILLAGAAASAARLGPGSSPAISASGASVGAGGGRLSTGGGDLEQEPDVEARVGAADLAVKAALLTGLEARIRTLTAAADAASAAAAVGVAAAPAGVGEATDAPASEAPGSAAAETESATAAAPAAGSGPTPAPGTVSSKAATASHARALAAACDAYGCLVWADGRPAEGEPQLRQARELLAAAAEAPEAPAAEVAEAQPPPAHLAAMATLHLGALLHLLLDDAGNQAGGGDEPELLLRSTLELTDDAAGGGSGDGGGGGGAFAPALLAAQARLFLAQILSLRASSQHAGSQQHRNAGGLYNLGAVAASAVPSAAAAKTSVGGAAPSPLLAGGASMQLPHGHAPAEVAPLLAAALPVFEATYGGEHPLTATLLSNMALALKDQGRLDDAEPLLRRALEVRERCHGPSHVDTMRSLNNLAGLVEAQGKLEEAEALLRRAAELAAGSLGPHHAHTATALSNLGLALRKAGKLEEAEELFKAALEIRETLLGPIALDTAASLSDMTLLLRDTGRLAEAEPLLRRILDIQELVLGPAHPDTAASLCDLASLLAQLDRCRDAEPLLRRAVSIYTAALGLAHEDTAAATRELASVLAQQGATAEAERHCRRALAVMEVSLGTNHPETILTVNQLALLLQDMGPEHEEEAEGLFRRVLTATDAIIAAADEAEAGRSEGGGEAADGAAGAAAAAAAPAAGQSRMRAAALLAMRGLAELLAVSGRLEEAELLCCRALVLAEKTLGPVHAVTLSCAEGLAAVLQDQDQLEDAAELYARLVETLVEELGEEREEVATYMGFYEEVYQEIMLREQFQAEERERQREAEHAAAAPEDTEDGRSTGPDLLGGGAGRTVSGGGGGGTTSCGGGTTSGGGGTTSGGGGTTSGGEAASDAGTVAPGPPVATAASSPTAAGGKKKHIRFGGNLVSRSAGSTISTFSAMLSRAASRGTSVTAGSRRGGDGEDVSRRGGGGGEADVSVHHSFASFVSRRHSVAAKSEVAASRAHSIVERLHSTLAAAGRMPSGMPGRAGVVRELQRHRSRFRRFESSASRASVGSGNATVGSPVKPPAVAAPPPPPAPPAAATAAGGDDDGAALVSPGLPSLGPEAEAAAGAASVTLGASPSPLPPASPSAPQAGMSPTLGNSTHGSVMSVAALRATPPRNSPRSTPQLQLPCTPLSVNATGFRDPANTSANGGVMYTTVTVVTPSNANSRATSGRPTPSGGRRSSTGDADLMHAFSGTRTNRSVMSLRGSLSKKQLLQQAQIDLDDLEDELDDLSKHPPPAALAKSASKTGSNRLIPASLDGVGTTAAAGGYGAAPGGSGSGSGAVVGTKAAAVQADEEAEDVSVRCCGLGGSRRSKVAPR